MHKEIWLPYNLYAIVRKDQKTVKSCWVADYQTILNVWNEMEYKEENNMVRVSSYPCELSYEDDLDNEHAIMEIVACG